MPVVRVLLAGVSSLLFCAAATCAAERSMQAAVRQPDGTLAVRTIPVPDPLAGQVRIKVRAAGVNPSDYGAIGMRNANIPPGFEVSGTIDALGPGVTGWSVGDEVICGGSGGGYAQYAVMPAVRLARKPRGISFIEAAGLPVAGETSYRSIIDDAKLAPGQRILIHGGAGGLGSAAVQIAHAQGAHVIATASSRNHQFLRGLGATEVIDYNSVRFEDHAKNLDVVYNTVDADASERSVGIVKRGGIIVSAVAAPSAARCEDAQIRCTRTVRDDVPTYGEILAKVVELVEAGKYKVNVDREFALADADQAWSISRQRHTRGKLIIVIPQ
jgi:NADPH:quinone reductase-like Zn-dependent oxidoreductase